MSKIIEFLSHTTFYLNFIGSGAFGQVFKVSLVDDAEDNGEEAVAAVKEIKLRAPAQRSDYMNEVETLSKLGSIEKITRLIASRLIDEKETPQTLHILTEYCDGGTLSEQLCNPSSEIDHLRWMLQLSNGLKYMHARGIAHRDVKPTNILIKLADQGEQLKICEFDLSTKTSEKHSASMIGLIKCLRPSLVFPRFYAAPEVVQMRTPYNVKSEVFSLGAIFYGMLERSYLEEKGTRHYGAFVVLPEHGMFL